MRPIIFVARRDFYVYDFHTSKGEIVWQKKK